MAKIKTKKKGVLSDQEKHINYFSEIPESDMLQVEHMILQDTYSYADVAMFIQKELKYRTDITERTLRDQLYGYNKFVLKPKVLGQITDFDVYKKLLALKGDVDAAEELTVLVLQQKERMNRILQAEQMAALQDDSGSMSKVHRDIAAQARREIKLMGDTLEKLVNLHMKTGVIKVAPRYISGSINQDDEKDPTKLTFKLTENFMSHMEDIESEVIDVIDIKEIEGNAKKGG